MRQIINYERELQQETELASLGNKKPSQNKMKINKEKEQKVMNHQKEKIQTNIQRTQKTEILQLIKK